MTKKNVAAGFSAPENYVKLCTPFSSSETGENALKQFMNDVYTLRNKHKIKDVFVIAEVSVPEGISRTSTHFGDSSKAIGIAYWALAQQIEEYKEGLKMFIEFTSKAKYAVEVLTEETTEK
jgi:hypothetical protein